MGGLCQLLYCLLHLIHLECALDEYRLRKWPVSELTTAKCQQYLMRSTIISVAGEICEDVLFQRDWGSVAMSIIHYIIRTVRKKSSMANARNVRSSTHVCSIVLSVYIIMYQNGSKILPNGIFLLRC